MPCFKYFSLSLAVIFTSPLYADDCWICDDRVELTKTYAKCFMENFAGLVEAYDTDDTDMRQVNMASCTNDAQKGHRGGVITMDGISAERNVKAIYTLSKTSAICLHDLISEFEGDIDPTIVFDLTEQCADE